MVLLREAGHGKGTNVVADGLRFRRETGQDHPKSTPSDEGSSASDGTGPKNQGGPVLDHQDQGAAGIGPCVCSPIGGAHGPPVARATPIGLFDPSTNPELQEPGNE